MHRKKILSAAALVTLTAPYAVPPASAAPEPRTPAPAAVGTITLVTGDTVRVTAGSVSLHPAPGREHVGFERTGSGTDLRVLPMDARPLVADGRLDARLFEVGELLAAGYGDRALPLEVTGRGKVELSADRAPRFWDAYVDEPAKVRFAGTLRAAPRTRAAAETHTLRVDMIGRDGRPVPPGQGGWIVESRDDPRQDGFRMGLGESVELPAGRYTVHAFTLAPAPDGSGRTIVRMINPDVRIAGNRELTFDARHARRVQTQVDRPEATAGSMLIEFLTNAAPGRGYPHDRIAVFASHDDEVYAGAVSPTPDFIFTLRDTRLMPRIRLTADGDRSFPVDVRYLAGGESGADVPELLGTNRMNAVYGGDGTPERLEGVRGELVVLDLPDGAPVLERLDAAAAAGARAVLLAGEQKSPWIERAPRLPVLVTAGTGLLDAVRTGPVPVTAHGVRTSPYRYSLFRASAGRMPDETVYRVHDHRLGSSRATYRGPGGTVPLRPSASALFKGIEFLLPAWETVPAPTVRTELFTPGVPFARQTLAVGDVSGTVVTNGAPRAYKPGATVRETMLQGVLGPSFAVPPQKQNNEAPAPAWAYRKGDLMRVNVQNMSGTATGAFGEVDPSEYRLFRDGELIDRTADGELTASPEPAEYRLEQEAAPSIAGWRTSTTVRSSWTFRSSRSSEAAALPLMAVRYLPRLDRLNRGPAGRRVAVPVAVEHQNGTPASVSVAVSFDGGAHWRPVQVTGAPGRWLAHYRNPDQGHVSLRATAKDTAGNTVDQTILHAYTVH